MSRNHQPLIILVEDDQVIAELLAYNLKEAGYAARIYNDGGSLLQVLENDADLTPDLFVLDLMLPGMDGFSLCGKIKQMKRFDLTPVLMLTARSSEQDKVRGLESGADDYLTKPFGMRELQARIQALLRRYYKTTGQLHQDAEENRQLPPADPARASQPADAGLSEANQAVPVPISDKTGKKEAEQPGLYRSSDLLLDDIRHRVYKSGREIEMTHREYELLKFLIMNRGIAFSRDDLLNQVWGFSYGGETRTVDVHIRQLRRKLEDDPADPVLIETVRGHGYRFNDQI